MMTEIQVCTLVYVDGRQVGTAHGERLYTVAPASLPDVAAIVFRNAQHVITEVTETYPTLSIESEKFPWLTNQS
jgi:hypothetical protein